MANVCVLDMGTDSFRLGRAGDPIPEYTSSTFLDESKRIIQSLDDEIGNVDDEDTNTAITSCMEHSRVVNWNDCELVLNHLFHQTMDIDPREYNIVIGESYGVSWKNREQILEMMFEKYNFNQCNIKDRGLLSLYGEGVTSTGVLCKVGAGSIQIRAICDGFSMDTSTASLVQYGGRDLTRNMIEWINRHCSSELNTRNDFHQVNRMKNRFMQLYPQRPEELRVTNHVMIHYTLPDETQIEIPKKLLVNCAESLFDPLVVEEDWDSVTSLFIKGILEAPIHTRTKLLENIVLSGGTTEMKGFDDRLINDLKAWRNLPGYKIKNKRKQTRSLNSWMGGSMLGTMYLPPEELISKAEYEEGNYKRFFKYPGLGDNLYKQ
jgi:actin-related protein